MAGALGRGEILRRKAKVERPYLLMGAIVHVTCSVTMMMIRINIASVFFLSR